MRNTKSTVTAFFVLLVAHVCSYGQSESALDLQQAGKARIEEKLVRLAWENNPANKIVVYNSDIAQKAFTQEKWSWLDRIRITGNLNEFTLNPDRYERSQFFPRYNFGVSLAVGDLATIPLNVQKRREEAEISKLAVESQKIAIRSEVLKKYNHYLSVRKQLSVQRKLESEIGANLELAKTKFNNNQLDYETFRAMSAEYYNQQLLTIQLEEALREATVDIEALIGVKLETVLAEN